ncbi:MAG: sterol desaturase family protein [Myxococcota bacterium]
MLYLLVGFLVGTLAEYLVHRLVGHGPGSEASDAQLLCRHSLAHHKVFTDRRGMTASRGETRRSHVHLQLRALFILLLLVVAAVGVAMSMGEMLNVEELEGFLWMGGGLLLALVLYEVLHTMHHTRLPPWLANLPGYKQARAWHHAHHREPDSRFGVACPVWDFVFFTHHGLREEEAPEEEEAEAGAPTAHPRTARRARPSTTMQDLLAATIAEADAEAEEDATGSQRKKRRKGARTTRRERQKPTTKQGRRARADQKPPTGKKPRPKTRSSWLNVMSTEDDIQDVRIEAVRDEDED